MQALHNMTWSEISEIWSSWVWHDSESERFHSQYSIGQITVTCFTCWASFIFWCIWLIPWCVYNVFPCRHCFPLHSGVWDNGSKFLAQGWTCKYQSHVANQSVSSLAITWRAWIFHCLVNTFSMEREMGILSFLLTMLIKHVSSDMKSQQHIVCKDEAWLGSQGPKTNCRRSSNLYLRFNATSTVPINDILANKREVLPPDNGTSRHIKLE